MFERLKLWWEEFLFKRKNPFTYTAEKEIIELTRPLQRFMHNKSESSTEMKIYYKQWKNATIREQRVEFYNTLEQEIEDSNEFILIEEGHFHLKKTVLEELLPKIEKKELVPRVKKINAYIKEICKILVAQKLNLKTFKEKSREDALKNYQDYLNEEIEEIAKLVKFIAES